MQNENLERLANAILESPLVDSVMGNGNTLTIRLSDGSLFSMLVSA